MYINNEFPEYLRSTPVVVAPNHPYAIVEPNSGEQILPTDFNKVLSARHKGLISNFPKALYKVTSYGDLIDRLMAMIADFPEDYGELQHHLMEQEGGTFVVGIQVPIHADASKGDFELNIVTTVEVPFDFEKFNNLYDDEEVMAVDDYAIMSSSVTYALTLIAQNTNPERPGYTEVLSHIAKGHDTIDLVRWEYIERELRHGISAIHVMRRWGLVDKSGIIPGAPKEYDRFVEIFNKVKEEKNEQVS